MPYEEYFDSTNCTDRSSESLWPVHFRQELAAAFSPELVDAWIYVIDVAAGDKIPRKGGQGIMRSDLLVINKIDLAAHVGASLEVMERDVGKMRGDRPFLFLRISRTVLGWLN